MSKLSRHTICVIALFLGACSAYGQDVYEEEYRPQFHFSPASGWIGDPDGLIRFEDKYHLFWWGHAESADLIHWNEKVHPMRGDDGSFHYYTGSVVVDKQNTSGFGDGTKPPMVAIYTAHNKTTGIQDQRISYSTDYETFHYYSGNPVLDIGSKEFRDPDVFWHEGTNRWIMAITLPVERKVNFYWSADLRSWSYLSSFGPIGAREQVWEVPQLLQLAVDGDPANKKWVLICSMGPNKMQYYIGDFDGTSFSLDAEESEYLHSGSGLVGQVFENFESGFGAWTVEGNAFGESPSSGTLANQLTVSGFLGQHLVNSYHGGDGSTGRLTSPVFTIEEENINFLIGGGNHASTSINLIVNGITVRTASGSNSEALKWKGWNVSDFVGQQAQIVILDGYTGDWGHVSVDHIILSGQLMNTGREHARWIDWGADFYAARAFRDYDNPSTERVFWIGWMGNWEYANQVPTTWGRGAESIPREIHLRTTVGGYQLVQTPIDSLENLRGEMTELSNRKIEGVQELSEFLVTRNTYELEATFTVDAPGQHFGFNLFAGPGGRTTLGFDAKSSSVYLDRRYAGNSSFSSEFPKLTSAPIAHEGKITFRIFVDQSCVEVFVNDGRLVFTDLVFPYSSHYGIELFSNQGAVNLDNLKAWPLASIWGIPPPPFPITAVEEIENNNIFLYPNPGDEGSEFRISTADDCTDSRIVVRDAKGMVLITRQSVGTEPSLILNERLPAGMYLVEIICGSSRLVKKMLIK